MYFLIFFQGFNCDELSTNENSSKIVIKNQELDTMPSVREEYKQKLLVKPTLEANFLQKNQQNRKKLTYSSYENLSERTVFINEKLNNNKKISENKRIPQNLPIKQKKVINEEVPNPLKKMKILKEERRLSRISSRNSLEEPLKEGKDSKDLAITIKDLSKPFEIDENIQEIEPFSHKNLNYSKNSENKLKEINENNYNNNDYIEKFLNHQNPLRNNSYNEREETYNDSSLNAMKNYFKNMKNLKINVDCFEKENQEKLFNTRMCLNSKQKNNSNEKNELSPKEWLNLMNKSQLKSEDDNYNMNNFINDMMEIYHTRKKDQTNADFFLQNDQFLESEKENLNMKLKCLSPVYREMKISARGNEFKTNRNQLSNKKRNSIHESSTHEHRKSNYIQPNYYQKNRDFSQFSKHFTPQEEKNSKDINTKETFVTYRDIKEKINVRKNIY